MVRFLRPVLMLSLFVCFALVFCCTPLLAQDLDPKLDALAGDLAQKIAGKRPFAKDKLFGLTYMVFDFRDSSGIVSELGVHLADEFSDALKDQLPGLRPVPRRMLREFCEREHLGLGVFDFDPVGVWVAQSLGPSIVVLGTVDLRAGDYHLHVRALDKPGAEIADAGQLLDWTEQRKAWHLQPPEPLPQDSPWKDVPAVGSKGYAEPTCVYCPNPPFTEAARKAKMLGTVIARVLIGEDGLVRAAAIKSGLPYGLSEQVSKTLIQWKYKPIVGPDGKPAQVQSVVELNFRLL